ncbi:MAG: hypothetical protein ACYC6C_07625 [Coriobacteriia bacterium]
MAERGPATRVEISSVGVESIAMDIIAGARKCAALGRLGITLLRPARRPELYRSFT